MASTEPHRKLTKKRHVVCDSERHRWAGGTLRGVTAGGIRKSVGKGASELGFEGWTDLMYVTELTRLSFVTRLEGPVQSFVKCMDRFCRV